MDSHDGPFTHGEVLYHYTTLTNALVYILPQRLIRFNNCLALRDPLESIKRFTVDQWDGSVFSDDLDDIAKSNQRIAPYRTALKRLLDEHKVLCLCRDASYLTTREKCYSFGYARPSLWQFYAGNHEGVCLAFDKGKLLHLAERYFENRQESVDLVPRPVDYPRVPAAFDLESESATDESTAYHYLVGQRKRLIEQLLFTKLPDWEREHEYRITAFWPSSDGPHDGFSYGDSLCGLIMGNNLSQPAEQAVRRVRDLRGVSLYRLRWVNLAPSLTQVSTAL